MQGLEKTSEKASIKARPRNRRRLAWGVIGGLTLVALALWGPLGFSLWNLWQFSNEFKPLPPATPVAQAATPTGPDAGLGLEFNRLGNFGLSTGLFSFRMTRPVSQADTQKEANFAVRLPTYTPTGFGRSDSLNLIKRTGFKFTLDLTKARPYLKELGIEVQLPDDLDGKTILVTLGDLVFTVYNRPLAPGQSAAQGRFLFASGLSGEIGLPDGITLDDFRQGAARVPVNRIPSVLYSQWGVLDPEGTNPLPVPPGMSVREVSVDGGAKGKIYRTGPTDDTTLAWHKDSIFYFINGGLSDQELIDIANSLK